MMGEFWACITIPTGWNASRTLYNQDFLNLVALIYSKMCSYFACRLQTRGDVYTQWEAE